MLPRFLLSSLGAGALALGTITPFCGWIFRCGCTLARGIETCNIFDPGAAHCPWCSHGSLGFYLPFGIIVAATVVTVGSLLRFYRPALWVGLLTALLAYLLWGSLVGLLSALYWDYPYFYLWTLP